MLKDGQVVGILGLHVDDAIGGGTDDFHVAMKKVSESLEVGTEEQENMHF